MRGTPAFCSRLFSFFGAFGFFRFPTTSPALATVALAIASTAFQKEQFDVLSFARALAPNVFDGLARDVGVFLYYVSIFPDKFRRFGYCTIAVCVDTRSFRCVLHDPVGPAVKRFDHFVLLAKTSYLFGAFRKTARNKREVKIIVKINQVHLCFYSFMVEKS